ncbi:MAG: DUF4410 domain-containing protein [Proteobacteria bacterium]|nr:DUF4410 domain-containing protein [Pseudomonadota bacterium]
MDVKVRLTLSLLGLLLCLVVASCGARGKMTVLVTPQAKFPFKAADHVEEPSNIGVPQDVQASFRQYLNSHLFYKGGFVKGKGLLIKYKFIDYRGGNQAARMFAGIFGAGRGWLMVEATFIMSPNQISPWVRCVPAARLEAAA